MNAVTQAPMKTLTCTGVREEPLRHRRTIQLQQQMDGDERIFSQGTLGRLTTTESETRKSVDKHMTQTRAESISTATKTSEESGGKKQRHSSEDQRKAVMRLGHTQVSETAENHG